MMMLWLLGLAGCGWSSQPVTAPPVSAQCGQQGTGTDCFLPVPGGTFLMGAQASDPEAPGYDPHAQPEEGPPHLVTVSPFWIQKHEYTVGAYTRCIESGDCSRDDVLNEAPHATLGQATDFDLPIVGVTYGGAVRGCAYVGGRLPTEAEWEFAARSTDGRHFPWGDASACGVAVRSPTGRWSQDLLAAETCENAGPRVPAELRGRSPYEVVGMAGNVSEWVADSYVATAYAKHGTKDPLVVSDGPLKAQRGGGWTVTDARELRSAARQAAPRDARLMDVGFRCVWRGQPAPGLAPRQPVAP